MKKNFSFCREKDNYSCIGATRVYFATPLINKTSEKNQPWTYIICVYVADIFEWKREKKNKDINGTKSEKESV